MGEVAVAVDAFREQFDAGIASLTPDIAVRPTRTRLLGPVPTLDLGAHPRPSLPRISPTQTLATTWKRQQRVNELCDRLCALVPAHVWCDALLDAGERLFERGQHELARRACFARVAGANLLDDSDERWKRAKEDRARGVGPTDRRRMHVLALFGRARCDGAMDAADDPHVRHPQTLERAKRALANLREATQEAYRGDESLYWLVHNGTVHIHAACERLMRNGHSRHAIESLMFAVACLESHILLAVPRYLDWRVTLASEVCACYDDVGDCDAHARAFIAKCVEHVDDLKRLEALDPVPQTLEIQTLYERADRRFRALNARYDETSTTDASAVTAEMEATANAPGDKARFLSALLAMEPDARTVRHAPPTNPAVKAAMEATTEWLAPLVRSMTVGLEHARAVRIAADALRERRAAQAEAGVSGRETGAEPAARDDGSVANDDDEEEKPDKAPPDESPPAGEGDAPRPDPTEPPPDLEPEAKEAYEAAVAELPLSLHDALMRRAFCYQSWETFKGAFIFYFRMGNSSDIVFCSQVCTTWRR